jgi:DNA mismatch repair ATPase MutL
VKAANDRVFIEKYKKMIKTNPPIMQNLIETVRLMLLPHEAERLLQNMDKVGVKGFSFSLCINSPALIKIDLYDAGTEQLNAPELTRESIVKIFNIWSSQDLNVISCYDQIEIYANSGDIVRWRGGGPMPFYAASESAYSNTID